MWNSFLGHDDDKQELDDISNHIKQK